MDISLKTLSTLKGGKTPHTFFMHTQLHSFAHRESRSVTKDVLSSKRNMRVMSLLEYRCGCEDLDGLSWTC